MRKKTIEDYVEIVYDLQKNNKPVHTNAVADALKINPASVTEIFQKLNNEGFIIYEKYGGAFLTKKGENLAINIKEKHEAIRDFLIILGVNKKIAEQDACEMEHILHSSTMDSIAKFVDVINQCKITPFFLNKLRHYIKTGEIKKCPDEILEICLKISEK
jgi:DtxR family Mn-dependent transcriptional regulator